MKLSPSSKMLGHCFDSYSCRTCWYILYQTQHIFGVAPLKTHKEYYEKHHDHIYPEVDSTWRQNQKDQTHSSEILDDPWYWQQPMVSATIWDAL